MRSVEPSKLRKVTPSRRVAYDVVHAVSTTDAFANLLLPVRIAEARLNPADAGFATELAYGTLRARGYYDRVIAIAAGRPVGKIDAVVLDLLRLGTHQLLGMRVAPHAAVDETVSQTRVVGAGRAGGFVNAVLRKVSADDAVTWRYRVLTGLTGDERVAVENAHPEWIVEAFRAALAREGAENELVALLAADNAAPRVALAALPGLATVAEVLGVESIEGSGAGFGADGGLGAGSASGDSAAPGLAGEADARRTSDSSEATDAAAGSAADADATSDADAGAVSGDAAAAWVWRTPEAAAEAASGVLSSARSGRPDDPELSVWLPSEPSPGLASPIAVLAPPGDPAAVPLVAAGRLRVQDEGSQLAALALSRARPVIAGERWLDLCAGPGGKAAVLAAEAKLGGATVVANELIPARAGLVRRALAAFAEDPPEVRVGDGRRIGDGDELWDRILLDAPCTGLGALRRRPEARWRKTPDDLGPLRELQSELLDAAIGVLAPGGVLAYVTCSPHLAETRDQVDTALERHPRLRRLDAREVLDGIAVADLRLGEGPDAQLWPHRNGTDAMFVSLLTVK